MDTLRLIESEGWLANRSSLTNTAERRLVDQNSASWNPLISWLRRIDEISRAA